MKKNYVAMIISAAMTAGLLSGCGANAGTGESTEKAALEEADENTDGEAAGEVTEEVVLNVYNWHTERTDTYNGIFEKFHEKYPNITVNYIAYDNDQYYNMLSTAIQSGESPDLFATHGTKTIALQNYADMGVCLPLDEYLDLSSYDESQIGWGRIGDTIYMSPAALHDDFGVYYNKDIFEKYGLSEPETWDDMISICDTLLENHVIPFSLPGLDVNTIQWFFAEMNLAYEPEWNDTFLKNGVNSFEEDSFLEALKIFEECRDKGYFGDKYDSMDANGAYMYFSSGNAAMMIDGSWMSGTYSAMEGVNIGVFHWPTKDGRKVLLNAASTETGYSVYSGTKHKEEAILLLKYLMSYEATQAVADLGNNVPVLGIAGLEELTSPDPIMNKLAVGDVSIVSFSDAQAMYVKEGYDASSILTGSLQNILFDEITPEDARQAFADMIDPAKYEK